MYACMFIFVLKISFNIYFLSHTCVYAFSNFPKSKIVLFFELIECKNSHWINFVQLNGDCHYFFKELIQRMINSSHDCIYF